MHSVTTVNNQSSCCNQCTQEILGSAKKPKQTHKTNDLFQMEKQIFLLPPGLYDIFVRANPNLYFYVIKCLFLIKNKKQMLIQKITCTC